LLERKHNLPASLGGAGRATLLEASGEAIFSHADSDIISMLDKREYPWYAAWDVPFNTLPLSVADLDFAMEQFLLMLPVCPSQWTDTGQ